MASFRSLPNEVVSMILSHLPPSDNKSFRLVSRAHAPATLPFLFRRVRLSRLAQDKLAFEEIAARPHLAAHAQELAWYELNLEAWSHPDTTATAADKAEFEEISELLATAASDPDVFWMPKSNSPDALDDPAEKQRLESIIVDYLPEFLRLLRCFPRLTTFASTPMRGRRGRRDFLYKGYWLSTDLYGLHLNSEASTNGNQGFSQLLLPAICSHQTEEGAKNNSSNKITSIRVAEEMFNCPTFFHPSWAPYERNVFARLTSIDLCLDRCVVLKGNHYFGPLGFTETLAACLRAATELRHLRLYFRDGGVRGYKTLTDNSNSRHIVCELLKDVYLAHLTSFHLGSIAELHRGLAQLASFYKAHAATLCSLGFEDYMLGAQDIMEMRSWDLLQLKSIRVTWPCHDGCLVEERPLLAYLRGAADACPTPYGDLALLAEDKQADVVFVTELYRSRTFYYYENDHDDYYDDDDEMHPSRIFAQMEKAGSDGIRRRTIRRGEDDAGGGGFGGARAMQYFGEGLGGCNTYENQTLYNPLPEGAEKDRSGLRYSVYKLRRELRLARRKLEDKSDDDHDVDKNDHDDNDYDNDDESCRSQATRANRMTRRWMFVHRDGRHAVGGDPLDYFSDWDSDEGDESAPYVHQIMPIVLE